MKHYHSLRKTSDFQLVYRKGRSKANKYLVFYYKKILSNTADWEFPSAKRLEIV